MKLVCQNCGARYEKGKFCLECGSPLVEVAVKKVLYCPSCETEVTSGKFCPECGSKLEEREVEIDAPLSADMPKKEHQASSEPEQDSEVETILAKYRDEYGDMRDLHPEEYAIAVEELQKCVHKGSAEAMCFLAIMYLDGHGVQQDYSTAYDLITEAEHKDYKYASAILAVFYLNGFIVETDLNEAIRRLLNGYRDTKIPGIAGTIAQYYIEQADYVNALKYAQEAADKGDKTGLCALGSLYLNGLGVEKNEQTAFEYYMQAAAQGEETALSQIGWMYMNGCGIEEDPSQAFFWFNEAAQKGSDVGMNNLAYCYQEGYGVEQDIEKAAEWFKKAAEAGSVDSMFQLGMYYLNVLIDFDKAKMWLIKAAEQGHAEATNCLGVYYADTEQNFKEAVKCYKKAIELGMPNAYRNLALCYRDGTGVKKDEKKAQELLAKAAELGIDDAEEINNNIRDEEDRLIDEANKDFNSKNKAGKFKAVTVYKELAENGNPRAQHNLAVAYCYGDGIQKDINKAIEWYKKSANQDFALAYLALAELYSNGSVEKDFDYAKKCLKKAINLGESGKRVKAIKEILSIPVADIVNFNYATQKSNANNIYLKFVLTLDNITKPTKINISIYRTLSVDTKSQVNNVLSTPQVPGCLSYYGLDSVIFNTRDNGEQKFDRLIPLKNLGLSGLGLDGSADGYIHIAVWDISTKKPTRIALKSFPYSVSCKKHLFSEHEWFITIKSKDNGVRQ